MPSPILVSPGDIYGHWRVLAEVERIGSERQISCECDCGEIRDVYLSALRRGSSTRCTGCRDKEMRTK